MSEGDGGRMNFRELLRKINNATRPMHVQGEGGVDARIYDAKARVVRRPITMQDEKPK